MAINFETALGIHPQALTFRERRGEQLAANLANADTPNYKARDMDFQSILKQTMPTGVQMAATNPAHFAPAKLELGGSVQYRMPNQASLDGNTVEVEVEQAKYAENNVQYQASLRFINGKFNDLKTAIRGE